MTIFPISCLLADALFPIDPDTMLCLPVSPDVGLTLAQFGLPLGEMEFEPDHDHPIVWVDGIRFVIEVDL